MLSFTFIEENQNYFNLILVNTVILIIFGIPILIFQYKKVFILIKIIFFSLR